jgi:peptide deformylase
MKKLKIVNFGSPILRQVAKPITVFHRKFHTLVDTMADTLTHHHDGAALAAPQIGVLKRITVINYEQEYLELINPELIAYEGEQVDYEGCLSFPGYMGVVSRYNKIAIRYYTRYGHEHTIEREGRLSRCIQHEMDHLEGVLFIDRMKTPYVIHQETEVKVDVRSVLDCANGKSTNLLPQP